MGNFDWEDETMSEETANNILQNSSEISSEEETLKTEDLSENQDEPQEIQEEEIDTAELMSNARLRLEQGRLYEMLLSHNLFDGVQSDSRAIKNVEREIRAFIKERLEILVGLKMDKPKTIQTSQLPFTDLEIQVLKKMLGKVVDKGIAPLNATQNQTSTTIKPLTVPTNTVSVTSKPKVNPIQRKPRETTKVEVEPLTKPAYKMTVEELKARAKKTAGNYKTATAAGPKKLPTPDLHQQVTHYSQNRQQIGTSGFSVGAILSRIGAVQGVENVGDPSTDF